MNRFLRTGLIALGLASVAAVGPAAQAQDKFPSKMMTWVVPFSAGGGADILSRIITSAAYDHFDEQPWRVVNKSGASGVVGWRYMLDQPADGYTVMQSSPTALIALLSEENPPVKPDQIKIVGYINTYFSLLVSQKDQPWSTWEGAVAYAKANPGNLTVGGTVSGLLMAGHALEEAGLDVTMVSYDGNGPAISDMLGGHISMAATTASAAEPLLPGQAAIVLNAGSSELSAAMAEKLYNPTSARSVGLRGLSFPRFIGVHPDTPDEIVQQLSDRFAETLKDKVVVRMFTQVGEEIDWVGREQAQKEYADLIEALPRLMKRIGM